MGTGDGAARAGDSAAGFLRRMLSVGFPAKHALESLNSLLVLRGAGGAVTVDLAEVDLSSGTAVLYKWGASPSWVLKSTGAEKIGTATPPPGLSVTDARETVARLSLRRGEVLILLSDGVEAGETLGRMELTQSAPPGELARILLEAGCRGGDDATAAVVCLESLG
jgi:stage II sporulation protein E